MSDVFISYSQSDRATAQMLVAALEKENWSIWWDTNIPPGKTFDEAIERALEDAKCVIVLWSKSSAASKWVKAEASEGNRRGILIPIVIELEAKIPLEFRYVHAAQLVGWEGQEDHTEFIAVRDAVAGLLDHAPRIQPEKQYDEVKRLTFGAEPRQTGVKLNITEDVYVDQEAGLMWTIKDNGKDVIWRAAEEYATHLTLGGYTDWRLPDIYELNALYDPRRDGKYKIREPFQLTDYFVWTSTWGTEDSIESGSAFNFKVDLYFGDREVPWQTPPDHEDRALCVRNVRRTS